MTAKLVRYRVIYIEEVLREVSVGATSKADATRQIKDMARVAGVLRRRIRYVEADR